MHFEILYVCDIFFPCEAFKLVCVEAVVEWLYYHCFIGLYYIIMHKKVEVRGGYNNI